jgi:ketosteroid isomerase-like protein
VTPNRRTVERYLDGFRKTDRARILSCLAEDVEWEIPGAFSIRGRDAFGGHIVDEGFRPHPDITVARWTEADDIVVAEGSVRTEKTDGTILRLAFCDVFEMRDGRIRRLTSYLMEVR